MIVKKNNKKICSRFVKQLLFVGCLIIFGLQNLKSQHQLIVNNRDTLNCSRIESDFETGFVSCHIYKTDSIYVVYYNEVTSIKYHHYPAYPDLKQPHFIVSPEFGISLAQYKQALGEIETNQIIRTSMKQGMYATLNLQYYPINNFSITALYSFTRFGDYRDSVKVKEIFNTVGFGIGYCGSNINRQMFITGQATVNYSKYETDGNISSNNFSGNNEILSLHLSPNINFHITEKMILRFSLTLNVMSKPPIEMENVFKPLIGTVNVGFGFVWLLGGKKEKWYNMEM